MFPLIVRQIADRRTDQLRRERAIASTIGTVARDATHQIDRPDPARAVGPLQLPAEAGPAGLLSIRKAMKPRSEQPQHRQNDQFRNSRVDSRNENVVRAWFFG